MTSTLNKFFSGSGHKKKWNELTHTASLYGRAAKLRAAAAKKDAAVNSAKTPAGEYKNACAAAKAYQKAADAFKKAGAPDEAKRMTMLAESLVHHAKTIDVYRV